MGQNDVHFVYIITKGQLYEARGSIDEDSYNRAIEYINRTGNSLIKHFPIPSDLYGNIFSLVKRFVQDYNAGRNPELADLEKKVEDLMKK